MQWKNKNEKYWQSQNVVQTWNTLQTITTKTKTDNVKHNIDGVQVTMITSSINNVEEEEVSEKEDHFFMPNAPPPLDQISHDLALIANMAMIVRDGNILVTNASSYVVPMGNVTPQHSAGSQEKFISIGSLDL
eukprot:8830666-Ditylum_brightwellii.AAC.1